jgi:quercetin 2,3-dioxygenase
MAVTVEIFRGSARFPDRGEGRMTWHSFSFGAHYDPDRVGFGPMVCHDEHLLADGRGFETHPHRGVDIITWVVSGAVRHTDSAGGSTLLEPGSAGVLSAGAGVEHSEIAAAPQTRFVQVWIASDSDRAGYAVRPVSFTPGAFAPAVELAAGELAVARLAAGESIAVPGGGLRHLQVASGALLRSSLAEPLQAGDAFGLRDETEITVAAAVPTELLLWSFPG